MPEVMANYRAGSFLVRAYAPEIAMGLQTVEELRDTIDVPEQPAPTKAAALAGVLKERLAATETPITPTPAPAPAAATHADAKPRRQRAADPQPPTDLIGDPAPSYAAVREALELAQTDDAKALALDQIRSVADEGQRTELTEIAKLLGLLPA